MNCPYLKYSMAFHSSTQQRQIYQAQFVKYIPSIRLVDKIQIFVTKDTKSEDYYR
jgi:hypothetical protein